MPANIMVEMTLETFIVTSNKIWYHFDFFRLEVHRREGKKAVSI